MVAWVKRYTPPTCCLEIVGQVSPLSIYLQKPTLKDLYFQLNFDDPRNSDKEQVTVRGDRPLLDSLCNIVSEYVQDFLTQPSNLRKLPPKNVQPYLYSQGLVHHKLHLGNLQQNSSCDSILLTAVQLFDLANALDEYSQEIATLPEFYRKQSRKVIPIFTAAAGIILAVGLTVGQRLSEPTPTTNELANDITTSEIPVTRQTPPQTEVVPPQPSTDKPINQAVLPPSLKDREKLSPPTPVTPPTNPQLNKPSSAPNQSQTTEVKPPATELVIIPQIQPQPQTNTTTKPEISITPQSPTLEEKVPSPETNLSLEQETPSTQIQPEENYQDELPRLSNENPNDTASLFDYIPQVAEVRDYFQDKWQPPEDLQQTLQYRLMINQNGYLQTVIPLGYNAEIYLPKIKFPGNNQTFVSPLSSGNNQVIRLVLQPNGEIITFLEK